VTLVHTHATEPAELVVRLKGGRAGEVHHTVLTHDRLNAHNTFAEPQNVLAKQSATAPRSTGDEIRCVLPPRSVNRLDIQLA
jgi:alpha-L-arabinofuranosidase